MKKSRTISVTLTRTEAQVVVDALGTPMGGGDSWIDRAAARVARRIEKKIERQARQVGTTEGKDRR